MMVIDGAQMITTFQSSQSVQNKKNYDSEDSRELKMSLVPFHEKRIRLFFFQCDLEKRMSLNTMYTCTLLLCLNLLGKKNDGDSVED